MLIHTDVLKNKGLSALDRQESIKLRSQESLRRTITGIEQQSCSQQVGWLDEMMPVAGAGHEVIPGINKKVITVSLFSTPFYTSYGHPLYVIYFTKILISKC